MACYDQLKNFRQQEGLPTILPALPGLPRSQATSSFREQIYCLTKRLTKNSTKTLELVPLVLDWY